ncbi:MAG: hypothetical protein MJ233_04275 [Mycoplasmoidaceae bacterium]|nr:hypothetical protein [Mycoplasmoidaceae bacterium]
MPAGEDDARILKNFFFQPTKPTYITSFIDLNNVYGGLNGTGTVYHCPLFKSDSSYKFFYGDSENESGVRYITNSVQVKLGKGVYSEGDLVDYTNQQPWILELNEAGMHAQTIDGYRYISNPSSFDPNVTDKQEASKNFIKYRLMQKLHGYDNGVISADLLDGQSPKLKTYFENNFADIILEMATKVVSSTDSETNIFRKIDSYKEIPNDDDKVLFLDIIAYDQKLASDADSLTAFKTYLDKTTTFGINKKCYDAIIKANDTIYGYRKTQIDNSKTSVGTKKFENGLLAPIAYGYEASATTLYNTTHQYDNVVELMDPNGVCTYTALEKLLISGDGTAANPGIESLEFVTNAMATGYDNDSAFSPQIKEAKKVESNRF